MKPKRIFLVRHGQSQGNADKNIYKTVPDYAVLLTEKGHQQAEDIGKEIARIIGPEEAIQFYVSPFWRTRQTFLHIAEQFSTEQVHYYEDLRLREQEWGQEMTNNRGIKWDEEKAREMYGHTYYRFSDGESCADAYDRSSDIMDTMFRSFEKPNFPPNVIVVSHGMKIRCFIMRWFHCSPEEFESWANPKNCHYLLLELGGNDKYSLVTPMKLHEVRHKYQFDWSQWTTRFAHLGKPKVPYEKPSVNENSVR